MGNLAEPVCCYIGPWGQRLERFFPNVQGSPALMARFWRRFLCCRAKSTVTVITRRITDDGFTVGAGPDPYSDYTESCDKHIGYLLGWQPEAKDTDEIFWEVWPR